ncbi:hypothetical protein ACK3TF_004820 [Chlorella vulgaris]
MERTPLKLPKLKTRDELLRTAPELGRLLAAGDGEAGMAASGRLPSPLKSRPKSSSAKRPVSPGRLIRKFSEDELTEEERVRAELEKVKAERATLLTSLGRLRADTGKSGGELQQEDIRLLRAELEAKQEKLNELRRATREMTDSLEQLETTSRDCEQLMPRAMEGMVGRAEALSGELAGVEQSIQEAEAQHELYKLLEIRTGRDHLAAQQRMRAARALKEGATDDIGVLTRQMHEIRAAKEDAERDLGAAVLMYDQMRSDWSKKLKDRRKEVRELERRRFEDEKRKAAVEALAAEKSRLEQDKVDRSRTDKEAATRRLSAVVPELEMLEATWGSMHGVCGAGSPEDLIQYWQDVKAKEAFMRELVRLVEVREARAKHELDALLAEKAEPYGTQTPRQLSGVEGEDAHTAASLPQPAAHTTQQATGAAAVAEPEQLPVQAAEMGGSVVGEAVQSQRLNSLGSEAADVAEASAGEAAEEQSLAVLEGGAERLDKPSEPSQDAGLGPEPPTRETAAHEASEQAAGQEATEQDASTEKAAGDQATGIADKAAPHTALEAPAAPAAIVAAAAAPVASAASAAAKPAAAAEADINLLLAEKKEEIAEARRRKQAAKEKFGKLTRVCLAADQGLQLLSLRLCTAMGCQAGDTSGTRRLTSLADDRRSSVSGRRTTNNRRTTAHQVAMRVSAAGLMERRASITLLPAPAAAAAAAGGAEASPRPARAAAAGPGTELFPELPGMVAEVGSGLDRLMQLVKELEAAELAAIATDAATVAAAAADEQRALLDRNSDMTGTSSEQEGVEVAAAADSAGTAGTLAETPAEGADADGPGAAAAGGGGEPPASSKRLQWADGHATPRLATAGTAGQGQEQEGGSHEGGERGSGSEGEQDPATAAAAAAAGASQGERELRRGFRRRTWAGPAWLNAVAAGKPLTATLRKMAASRSKPAGTPGGGGRGTNRAGMQLALKRIAGYAEEPSSDGEGPNPFVLSSSEGEDLEDGVVDRQYLKHRSHKLTNPRVRGKAGHGAAGSASQAGSCAR